MSRSAAKLWCPNCADIHPCRSVSPSYVGEDSGNRFYREDAEDVRYFRRFRECTNCGDHFETSEVEAKFLDELITLRSALADLKRNASDYEADAKKAASKLRRLGKSLAVLKVLS